MEDSIRAAQILLVEDNPTDVLITRDSLENAKMLIEMNVVEDGVEALQYLRREGRFSNAKRPDLILLDLNLPRKDGREVLQELKSDPRLNSIPVVVLTISEDQEDIARAYGTHANAYVSKPLDFETFSQVVRAIENFWFTVVRLPQATQNEKEGG